MLVPGCSPPLRFGAVDLAHCNHSVVTMKQRLVVSECISLVANGGAPVFTTGLIVGVTAFGKCFFPLFRSLFYWTVAFY